MNADTPLQLLGGLTARVFLRDYWQKKPLLIRQAIPDFESPISADELAGLALEEEVESRLVLEHGERPRAAAWVRTSTTTTYFCCRARDSGAGGSARCAMPRAHCWNMATCASWPTSNKQTNGCSSPATCSTCPHVWLTTALPRTTA